LIGYVGAGTGRRKTKYSQKCFGCDW